ncbi:MAG: glycosyltransferase family 2 protein [Bacteroidia bacterium]|nr:glycosyltransferase family 2 protein [Bacteroidia bacterium]
MLKICLSQIEPLLNSNVELLVIDNGTEKVDHVVKEFTSAKYFSEENTGLSYARNRAIIESSGDWVFYIDDDAKANKHLISTALEHCSQNHFVFGGVYLPWYHYGKPKWFKDHYASNQQNFSTPGKLPKNEYLSGGVLAIHKKVFLEIGNFNTALGMTGTVTGYGEESELQDRMIVANFDRFYDDKLIIEHVVAEYKLTVNWFLKSNYKRGVDMAKYQTGFKLINVLKEFFLLIIILVLNLIEFTPKLLSKSDYFFENWRIDVFKKFSKRKGFIVQTLFPKNT